jgi:aspartyl-tRNA(Asn)/glutamyl-tRNA(Gln) amidotransferase subunit C
VEGLSEITVEQVRHVAHLARLKLSKEEEIRYTKELNDILRFMDKLNQLDTENVPPTSHVLGISNVIREDVTRPSWPSDDVMKNAPAQEDGHFKVPAVLGE